MPEFKPDDPSTHDYTVDAEKLRRLREQAERTQRHLINRDSPVLEGVYGGAYGGEAIVVDYKDRESTFDELVDEAKKRATVTDDNGVPRVAKDHILDAVMEVVREQLPYSLEGVDKIFKDLGGQDFKKIGLSYYIGEGVGVCRHQALLAATMLELLKAQGVVSGTARVNRSQQWPERGEPGGHAWVRYTNSAGDVYIIDPAQNFIGSIEESRQRSHGWNYLLPEDKARHMGNKAVPEIIDRVPGVTPETTVH